MANRAGSITLHTERLLRYSSVIIKTGFAVFDSCILRHKSYTRANSVHILLIVSVI